VLATVTARVGYAWDRWLAYAKGGYAGADVELTLADHVALVRASSDTWANEWTVGAGAEYALGRRFSLGVEYSFADLDTGRFTLRCLNCGDKRPGGLRHAGRRRRHRHPIRHRAAELPLRQLAAYFAPNTRAKIVSTCFR